MAITNALTRRVARPELIFTGASVRSEKKVALARALACFQVTRNYNYKVTLFCSLAKQIYQVQPYIQATFHAQAHRPLLASLSLVH